MNIFVWLFESSLLIVMVLGIRKLFTGKIPYSGIYALWGIVLLRLVLPVNLFSTHLSLENFFVGEQRALVEQESLDKKPSSEPGQAGMDGKNPVQKAVSPDGIEDGKKDMQEKAKAGEGLEVEKEAGKGGSAIFPAVGRKEKTSDEDSMTVAGTEGHMEKKILFLLWSGVAFVVFCWVVFSNFQFLRRVKRNRVLLGSRGRVRVYAADVAGSCLYGVFTPSVYLPAFLVRSCLGGEYGGEDCKRREEPGKERKAEKEEKEKRAEEYGRAGEMQLGAMLSLAEKHPQLSQVLAHEFIHYRHGDHIWAMVRTAILAVYWFHPLVWLSVWLSGKDAELCCDEATVRQLGEENRFNYGEMLIHLSAGGAGQERLLYSAVFMSRRGKDMEKRIRAISERRKYSRWLAVPLVILLLAAVGMTCSRAISSSGQPDTAANLDKGDATGEAEERAGEEAAKQAAAEKMEAKQEEAAKQKTAERMEAKQKEEDARQQKWEESREIYQSFLEGNRSGGKYRYYSLAELEKGQYVLLTADHVMEIIEEEGEIFWSTSNCRVHCIVSGQVVSLGKIACSSSGEWIHLWEDAETGNRKLVTNSHHSVSRFSLKDTDGEAELEEDIREEFKKGQEKEYWQWNDELYLFPSVIFYTNPAVENVTKKEPKAMELAADLEEKYAKRYLSHDMFEVQADITGDGVEDSIRVEYDKVRTPASDTENSVTITSGSSGKEIYGLNVNLVHSGWEGVYFYKGGGRTSLMRWKPVMYQGIANYHWEIYDVSEDGKEMIIAQDSFSFDLNHVKEGNPEKLEAFVERLNSYLKDTYRLVLISDGRLLEGGAADYGQGGHYKGDFDSEGNWNVIYTAEEELKTMREALGSGQDGRGD